jgi:hypothetical protein
MKSNLLKNGEILEIESNENYTIEIAANNTSFIVRFLGSKNIHESSPPAAESPPNTARRVRSASSFPSFCLQTRLKSYMFSTGDYQKLVTWYMLYHEAEYSLSLLATP